MVERSEENPEELPQVHVVGGLLEPEAATVAASWSLLSDPAKEETYG